jgi:capsular polysaccharide biosynthesis protein
MIYSTSFEVLSPKIRFRSGLEPNKVVTDSLILPHTKDVHGGILDCEGNEILEARLVRGAGQIVVGSPLAPTDLHKVTKIGYGTHCYAGALFWHFGHFLLEGLARISAVPGPERSMPHIFHDLSYGHNAPHINFFLSCLGISAMPITVPTRIHGDLIIPPARLIIKHSIHRDQLLVYKEISDKVLSQVKKYQLPEYGVIYLSRANLSKDNRHITNEVKLQAALIKLGFQIIHMQELNIDEQIRIAAKAKLIVGPIGSAMHLTVFSPPEVEVVYLLHGACNQNYPMMDSLSGHKAHYLDFERERDGTGDWAIDIEETVQFLDTIISKTWH